MVVPVALCRQFAGENGELSGKEIAEGQARRVQIFPVAIDEIHRHIEHIVGIAFVAEAILEDERQHSGPRRIGIGPDVRPVAEEAVGLALGEGRIGEERGAQRLERKADPELLHHVRLGFIIEVGLDRAGAQHHVEPHRADAGHVAQHDRIAALGHDGKFGAGLVGPHPEAEEAEAEFGAHFFDLLQVATGFRAGLVQVFERGAGKLELPGRFEADGAVASRQGNHIAPLDHRFPAEAGKRHQQIANAARFVIGRRPPVGRPVDELFMFGADAPACLGLLAL